MYIVLQSVSPSIVESILTMSRIYIMFSFYRNQKGEFSSHELDSSFVDRNTKIYQCASNIPSSQISYEVQVAATVLPFELKELQLFDQH